MLNKLISRQIPVILPSLLLPEVSGAMGRQQLNDRNKLTLALDFSRSLQSKFNLQLVPLDRTLAEQTSQIAATYRLRGADAVFVAVAQTSDTTLISLDREHLQRATALIPVQRPAQILPNL